MYTTNPDFKKIQVTVNGEPVGNGLLLDSVTFRPITDELAEIEISQSSVAKS